MIDTGNSFDANENDAVYNSEANVSAGVVRDSTQDSIQNLANELNIKLNDETKDYLYQYYLQRKNDEWAFQKQSEYDSMRYQRAVEDMKKAGLNPFLAMSSLSAANSSIDSGSISSGFITSRKNSQLETAGNVGRGVLAMLGIIAAAVIGALL